MNLCIDIGNTNTKLGVFDVDGLKYFFRTDSLSVSKLIHIEGAYPIKQIAVCSSGMIETELKLYLENKKNCLWLHHNTAMPIQLKYETPNTLGRDRIAAANGAFMQYHGKNAIIIATGTCITIDLVSAKGEFLGGNISPGLEMKLRALHEFTAGLPRVDIHYSGNLLGKNTIEAIQNGVVRGTIWEMESFISEAEKIFDDIIVIICGGNTGFFVNKLKNKIFAHPNLVLEGLNFIIKFGENDHSLI